MSNIVLKNPYVDLDEENTQRINAGIPKEVYLYIKTIHPTHGILQAMVNNLINGCVLEARAIGLSTYADSDEFVRLIQRRSAVGPLERRREEVIPGGPPVLHQPNPPSPNLDANNASVVGSGEQTKKEKVKRNQRRTRAGKA